MTLKSTHLDEQGRARMVDVSAKAETLREATALAVVKASAETLRAVEQGSVKKGDVLAVAQVAGIQAAKRTPELIPMCHPLPISSASIAFETDADTGRIEIRATVKAEAKTGVEMEAMTAASIAALTVYDMCKSLQRDIEVERVVLLSKKGGKSGEYRREK